MRAAYRSPDLSKPAASLNRNCRYASPVVLPKFLIIPSMPNRYSVLFFLVLFAAPPRLQAQPAVDTSSAAAAPPAAPVAASTPTVQPAAPAPAPAAPAAAKTPLKRLEPGDWPPIADELDAKSLEKAAARTLRYLDGFKSERKSFKIGDMEVGAGLLADTARAVVDAVRAYATPEQLEARLKEGFDLYQSIGSDGEGKVIFSSYYQPTLSASLKQTPKYRFPIYKRPKDLVQADFGAFNPKLKGETALGRVKNGELVPYFDRRDIDVRKALAGKHLEVAWLANQFDRLDLHIEGSGILELPSGKRMLAKYAGTNALPYKSVGLALANSGAVTRAELSHERLRQYLTDHPEGEGWLLAQNPRYTFFELTKLPEDGQPFGTIEQPLTPGRSIAIDPKVIPLGAVAYFRVHMPQANHEGELLGIFPTSRLVMCQDTGGAIQGPGRVDIFMGSGKQAKASAVSQWHEGRLYILLKKLPPRER